MSDDDTVTPAEPPKKKKPIVAMLGLLVVGVGIGAVVGRTVLADSSDTTTMVVEVPTTEPAVDLLTSTSVQLDPITVNLAGGRYVQIGLTVVMTAGHDTSGDKESAEPDTDELKVRLSPIAEQVIGYVSGRTLDEVTARGFTDELKDHLMVATAADFDDRIIRISVNQFIAQ